MKTRGSLSVALGAGLLFALAAPMAHAQVTNGGFETGNLTGWTISGNSGFTGVANGSPGGGAPHSGLFDYFTGEVGHTSVLSQNLTTVTGQVYDVRFWLANTGSGSAGTESFEFDFGQFGVVSPTYFDTNGYTTTGSVYHEFSGLFAANGTTTNIKFIARNDPNYFLLDDVSVKVHVLPTTATPEFGSVFSLGGLLLAGGAGLWFRRRKTDDPSTDAK